MEFLKKIGSWADELIFKSWTLLKNCSGTAEKVVEVAGKVKKTAKKAKKLVVKKKKK